MPLSASSFAKAAYPKLSQDALGQEDLSIGRVTPEAALAIMIELNNKYALDGRNPNSYSGIFWVLGRYDRAWGPERAVFGKVRYMSSESTVRKLELRRYLEEFGP